MTKSESIAALAAALAKAQGEMRPAVFDSKNPHFNSRYASLPSVWDSIREPLSKNGLSIIQMPIAIDGKIAVKTMIMHASGEWIATELEAGALPMKNKKRDEAEERDNGCQALGVVVSYLRRYTLAAVVGQVADDDDDAESVTDHKPSAKSAPKSEPKADAPAGGLTDKQRKMLWALGCQIWQTEDEHGELKPDKERIVRELEQRSKDLGFEFATITSKQASALIEIFTDLKNKAQAATRPSDNLGF